MQLSEKDEVEDATRLGTVQTKRMPPECGQEKTGTSTMSPSMLLALWSTRKCKVFAKRMLLSTSSTLRVEVASWNVYRLMRKKKNESQRKRGLGSNAAPAAPSGEEHWVRTSLNSWSPAHRNSWHGRFFFSRPLDSWAKVSDSSILTFTFFKPKEK